MSLIFDIDAILPQTQCTKCGYKDCLAYAKAIASGVPHNQCPPGGEKTIKRLSTLLKRPIMPLNPNNGREKPKPVAKIQEDLCIGCTKCIDACPVDAIMGTGKMMHTVLTDQCTGCDLCVEPCPVDCIDLIELPLRQQPSQLSTIDYTRLQDQYRKRHYAKQNRLVKQKLSEQRQHRKAKNSLGQQQDDTRAKQRYIDAAIMRVKQKILNVYDKI